MQESALNMGIAKDNTDNRVIGPSGDRVKCAIRRGSEALPSLTLSFRSAWFGREESALASQPKTDPSSSKVGVRDDSQKNRVIGPSGDRVKCAIPRGSEALPSLTLSFRSAWFGR